VNRRLFFHKLGRTLSMANTCMLGLPHTGGDVGIDGQNPVTGHRNGCDCGTLWK